MKTFDGHNDLLLNLWLHHQDDPAHAFFTGIDNGHLDYPRMQKGGFAGGLFALFVPPQEYIYKMAPHRAEACPKPKDILWQQLAILKRLIADSEGRAKLCLTSEDIARCRHEEVLAMVAHIEGADCFDHEGEDLAAFYAAGVRSIGPFWNLPNAFGEGICGAFPGSPNSGPGLTPAGKKLIRFANQYNILVDVSHMNERAFWDTASLSSSPLVATHSNAHALCPQPRNLTDDQLRAIRDSNGVVGINFGNAFLRADGQRNTHTALSEIVKMCEYLVAVMGEDHVAFGSDFDGVSVPESLGDVAGLPHLYAEMQRIIGDHVPFQKLAWENWQRVLRQIWQS